MLVPTHEIMTEEEIADEFSDVEYDFKDLLFSCVIISLKIYKVNKYFKLFLSQVFL